MTYYLPLLLVAVQNERQPRSTAHVSLDSICLDTRKEHLATTRELTSSATYSSVICRPLVTSSVTSSATTQPCSNPSNNHRFMVSLLTAETCAKLEPENGEITGQNLNLTHWVPTTLNGTNFFENTLYDLVVLLPSVVMRFVFKDDTISHRGLEL